MLKIENLLRSGVEEPKTFRVVVSEEGGGGGGGGGGEGGGEEEEEEEEEGEEEGYLHATSMFGMKLRVSCSLSCH